MSDQSFDQHGTNRSTRDVAMEETAGVASDAKEGARSVAQTAGAEVQNVAGEARDQISSLYQQVRQDVGSQASDQQRRAAGGLHGLAGELTQMADGAESSSLATSLARQAAERLDGIAGWIEQREPADLLEEVRRYARRNPGTFLAACAAIGLVGGRLTRGLRDEASAQDARSPLGAPVPAYGGTATAGTTTPLGGEGYGGRPGPAATTYTAAGAAVATPGYDQPVGMPGSTDAMYDDDLRALDGEGLDGERGEVYPATADAGLLDDGGDRR